MWRRQLAFCHSQAGHAIAASLSLSNSPYWAAARTLHYLPCARVARAPLQMFHLEPDITSWATHALLLVHCPAAAAQQALQVRSLLFTDGGSCRASRTSFVPRPAHTPLHTCKAKPSLPSLTKQTQVQIARTVWGAPLPAVLVVGMPGSSHQDLRQK